MPLRYNEPTERVLGTKKKRKMKILSLFDGISCGMVALQRAGIEVERYDAYEIEKAQLQYLKRIIQISVIVEMSTMRTFQNTMILICLLVAVRVRIGVLQEKTEKQQVRVLDSICLCSL